MWFKLIIPFTLLALCLVSSCQKNKSENVQKQIKSNLLDGIWKISKYNDDGKNKTEDFADYDFTFLENGTVHAATTDHHYLGDWMVAIDAEAENSDDPTFNIHFADTTDLYVLDEDWYLLSQTGIKMEWMVIISKSGDTDFLTISKK
ncbi:hypothetical protein DNU06_04050 [Putridiphycobacter roseus]|uniref:Lipocalin-like domain-containing protein n=1 Tax=Putridiphycobacter roseus TaxID=2219161 RepID=A0A2W1N2P1_9FLAO|nr:hypothetical protein [Putridiphycobacter roseus]PZE17800.1 hypothetical protein DNU06_04050 [Putridiphycobacter roseus]